MRHVMDLIDYFIENAKQLLDLTVEHIEMTAMAVGFSLIIGVPLGILISYVKKLDRPVIGVANIVQAIPSMALLGLAIPLFGIGTLPAVVMVIIYSLLPIVKNTYTGISNIDAQLVEAATGIGLTKWQVLYKVKIPLALPVIMAGVRISAVTAVGLMTMAAYIGAGGLGYMVFSGIRTVNNLQILAGAIPACLLALLIDYLMSNVEKLVTPVSLQKQFGQSKDDFFRKRRRSKAVIGVALLLAVVMIGNTVISGISGAGGSKKITIGGKDFTEQFVLAYMYADMIEANTDIEVEVKDNLGGTQVCYEALKKDEIDMYIDYTGTVYVSLLNHQVKSDMEAVYNECKEELAAIGIEVLEKAELNNTYTLAVTPETAEKYKLKTISDLQRVDDKLVIGTTLEFQNRPDDGLPGLISKYGFTFKDVLGIDGSLRFTALVQGETDIVDAFATDGMLKKYGLTVLKDEDGFFPPYNAIPLIDEETLKEYPELEDVINLLSSHLTDEVMQNLNYLVDEEGREPSAVAREFLEEEGLI